ncbi:hypothetical protein FSARC_14242 [Fusarium sarcochroum]|uniref:Uncharacterized protein n=1 Tax=Fusarium sarcochroum TaxID=1208366 RepID=A0A8H4SVD5_9HYPO|nr:hypothetical protein FSARC_14242 [Fusarium sarcochroum]
MCIKESKSVQVDTQELFRVQSTTSSSTDEQVDDGCTATFGYQKPILSPFDLSKHPGFNTCRLDVLNNEANFLSNSRVDVLTVSGPESTLVFNTDQNDAQVEGMIDRLLARPRGTPELMVSSIPSQIRPPVREGRVCATDTTIYLVVAPDEGIWFSFIDLIGLATSENGNDLISRHELATSPFLIHSMISNIAFEQSTIYTADARVRLMTELQKVNNYSDISQMINTGLGSSSSAAKLSVKLLEAHKQFCQRTGLGAPGTAVSRTQTAIQYVHDVYLYQQSWLEQYKTRKETAMNLVFNMVTQGDSFITLNTSYQMSQDSSSILAPPVLAMIFLPGTFTAV